MRKIFDAAQAKEGFTALIKEMAGITGKRGKPIKYPQIYEILRNEKYTGLYAYSPVEAKNRADRRTKPDSIKIENALPVIISKAQFMEVQKIMECKETDWEKIKLYVQRPGILPVRRENARHYIQTQRA